MIYKFRVLSDEDELFLRDFEIDSEDTFHSFHQTIQENLGFDPMQLASFFLADENWNKGMELTLIDMQNNSGLAPIPMNRVKLKELIKTRKDRLLYSYDIFADRNLFIELIDIIEPKEGVKYPSCSAALGEAPIQLADDIVFDIDSGVDEKNEIDELFDEYKDFEFGSLGFENEDEF